MHKVFGDYIEKFPPELDSLEMIFTPTADSIRKRWSNNRLSAQFVADYCSAFLPVDDDDPDGDRRIQESKGSEIREMVQEPRREEPLYSCIVPVDS